MATYKVIQDIEAEDKLIGPFGIRQFIYLIIVFVSGFIIFKLGTVAWFLAIPLIPHTLFFALLALPFGGNQSTETWLLAKIRFALKPRRRVWDQSGIKTLVTITAPKKLEKVLMHDMSEREIKSRLEALANTIDSRGWAIKNVNVNMFSPAYSVAGDGSDRLLGIDPIQQVPEINTTTMDDMLDVNNNPTAQNFDRLINESSKAHREQLLDSMRIASGPTLPQPMTPTQQVPGSPATQKKSPVSTGKQPRQQASNVPLQNDYWFDNQGSVAPQLKTATSSSINDNLVTPDPSAAQKQSSDLSLQPLAPESTPLTEEELLEKIHEKQSISKHPGNLRVIKTLDEQRAEEQAKTIASVDNETTEATVTTAPDPDIIELARNDDLSVETVARRANKSKERGAKDEVVINLLH